MAHYKLLSGCCQNPASGFGVLNSERTVIGWNMDYHAVYQAAGAAVSTSYPTLTTSLVFKAPVRLANIWLSGLGAFTEKGSLVSFILDYLWEEKDNGTVFKALTAHLKEVLPEGSAAFFESEDYLLQGFYLDDINLVITHQKKGCSAGKTTLYIDNYSEKTDIPFSGEGEVKNFIAFDNPVSLEAHYKEHTGFVRTPFNIQFFSRRKAVIWVDEAQRQLGYSNGKYAGLLNLKDLETVYIQNIAPAKGSGGAELKLQLRGDPYPLTILESAYQAFDSCTEKLEQLLESEVLMLKTVNDV